jgi:hypothetical protein
MRLGIVATDSAHATQVAGLVEAARQRGWDAECFLTDTGVMLLADDAFLTQARARPGSVSVCEHSVERYARDAYDVQSLADIVVIGGQYQDAELVRRCDKVLVF